MKINQIIRQRRRELSLTQEQVAAYLGVSTPAVNKWEKGSTYPDITLLPALARLLRTDLNTLLSFQEDLSDVEIETFVDHLDQMVQEQGYQAAFQAAWGKVQEYPTCEALLYSAALYLEGALSLYPVQQPEEYQTTLETWYQRLARSDTQEIRDTAVGMLISYARNRGEFSKAEELIQTLPDSPIDKEEQLAILYQRQGKYEQAQGIWEHRILHGVTEIQTALMNKLEWALLRKRPQEAEALADLYETVTSLFCFPGWMRLQRPPADCLRCAGWRCLLRHPLPDAACHERDMGSPDTSPVRQRRRRRRIHLPVQQASRHVLFRTVHSRGVCLSP